MTIDEKITDLYVNHGFGTGRISKIVGLHKTSIEQRIRRLKIKRDTSTLGKQTWFPTQNEINLIKKFYCFDGLEVSEIGKILSQSEHLIRKYIKKYKLIKAVFRNIKKVEFQPRHFQSDVLSTAESYKDRIQIALTGGNLNFFFQLQSLIYELVPEVTLISIYTQTSGVYKLSCTGNSAKNFIKFYV